MLKEYLEIEGFRVSLAHNGEQALQVAMNVRLDAMVLDVMMPKMNGFDVLRKLRTQSNLPVLMLTARGEDVDSIIGLELGADDYLGKPSNPRVLVARLRALLRRSEPSSATGRQTGQMKIADLSIDARSRVARLDGAELELTSTEFNVLYALVKQAGEVVTKADLSRSALARPLELFDRSLDMHVSHLRRKLGPGVDGFDRIKTVRGIGYQLVVLS